MKVSTETDYYTLEDNYLKRRGSPLKAGCLLEVTWHKHAPGKPHAIELDNGWVVVRYVHRLKFAGGHMALEISAGGGRDRKLLMLKFVRRVGRARHHRAPRLTWPEYIYPEGVGR